MSGFARAIPETSNGGSSDRQHPDLRLHSVHIFVRDQERSLAFYLDTLGFELVFDARLQSGERWLGVSPPNGTAVLTLIQPKPESADRKLIGRATRVVFVTEDVLGKFRDWSNRGVRFRHPPRLRRVKYEIDVAGDASAPPASKGQVPIWGEVFTRFEDIDRNSFALVSFDAVTAAIEAQRRAHAERLEADRRFAYELDVARQVQSRLFPQQCPQCAGLVYAGTCAQARHVGGDYYDFLALGEERIGLVVGDVAGKGIAASLLMANLQAHLRSQCAVSRDQPEGLLRSVNQLFFENTSPSAYATLFFGEYDGNLRRLRYVNCGHLSGLLLHVDQSIERLAPTATVLGLFQQWDCSTGECELLPGDVLALYTDGITESFNDAGEDFGEDRLLTCLKQYAEHCPAEMIPSILADVRSFSAQEQHDDITLLIAKCLEPQPGMS
ncbi:MAG: SpoIIE family protein phosphatase [Acidobacteriaceae bacterium]|nr:SpoIIE family protein phosphatase [Acidobacteriaceae bacterium]